MTAALAPDLFTAAFGDRRGTAVLDVMVLSQPASDESAIVADMVLSRWERGDRDLFFRAVELNADYLQRSRDNMKARPINQLVREASRAVKPWFGMGPHRELADLCGVQTLLSDRVFADKDDTLHLSSPLWRADFIAAPARDRFTFCDLPVTDLQPADRDAWPTLVSRRCPHCRQHALHNDFNHALTTLADTSLLVGNGGVDENLLGVTVFEKQVQRNWAKKVHQHPRLARAAWENWGVPAMETPLRRLLADALADEDFGPRRLERAFRSVQFTHWKRGDGERALNRAGHVPAEDWYRALPRFRQLDTPLTQINFCNDAIRLLGTH